MKRKLAFSLCLIALSVFTFFSFKASSKPGFKSSIIGKWRVTSENSRDIKNHTYEFSKNNSCIEKYRSMILVGPIDEPPNDMEVETVTTYRYKALGGKRFRLYQIKSVYGPQVDHSVPTWHIIDVTITKDKAVVYEVDRQQLEIEKKIAEALKSSQNDKGKERKNDKVSAKKNTQTWLKAS